MKKWLTAVGLIVICAGIFVFYNKLYYPPLPMGNISKKEVVEKVKASKMQITKLTSDNGNEWYITSKADMRVVGERIKDLVSTKGWVFTQKDGNGLFFEKQGERLVVSTQMWTSAYVLIQIPDYFQK
ncbi:hypothetical protein J7E73_08885 [Paenibacillus albidus]|uniref:hypothetical protein n=1 Tax=Paenibacillus albidus TaxID=2041023 RepID=UPI001BE70D4B|nr:hypothetical protein [Paenibacillus albidus]MBT2289246.1 hypothetical protein [Paenibacillus albidus]